MAASLEKFQVLAKQINDYFHETDPTKEPMSIQEISMGFIRVANEAMCRPIRALTQSRGYDTSKHALSCFGGAGGQHACSIAKELGMKQVLIHKYAGKKFLRSAILAVTNLFYCFRNLVCLRNGTG